MVPAAVAPAQAGTKRKFNMFAVDQDIFQFEIDGERFTVHKDLIVETAPLWWLFERKLCSDNTHPVPATSAWVFRGFMYWLYNNTLPTESVLEEIQCPEGFDIGNENEPLMTSMAVELHYIGENFDVAILQDECIAHLFNTYRTNQAVSDAGRLHQVFCEFKSILCGRNDGLRIFCNDICLKRLSACKKLIEETMRNPALSLPPDFVSALCQGHYGLPAVDQARRVLSGGVVEPLVLRDYLTHARNHSKPCSSEEGIAGVADGDEFVIET
ncbi:hypothetical protein BU23DRAFT_566179 [Bimuria novae-zelandiae CBS 107.79]|uniref:BTB domain-containing protein n=1 Tax=Bimuria novae-zelandiae CBS 107.79 TaxID=1447943 RepID=A0A6A5VGZ8_9PLEO|nr:hypothetical protein BU23DRAFT_566179 [Bimuria novae-zelandiae CBS 107.79]